MGKPSSTGEILIMAAISQLSYGDEITWNITALLAAQCLNDIRPHFRSLSMDEVMRLHCDRASLAPDFIHPAHIPQSYEVRRERVSPQVKDNTAHHFLKLYDMMTMPAADLHGMNLYLASTLANFADYRVRW